jgi:hypothetical protein
VVGRVPYDTAVTRAQVARQTVVEASDGPAARAIRDLWAEVHGRLQSTALACRERIGAKESDGSGMSLNRNP